MFKPHYVAAVLIAAFTIGPATLLTPMPASADGAASTRNIFLAGAAAVGSLLIINHNKKVHERYAEDSRRQAELENQRNDAEAAYHSEKHAYEHEVALVGQYKKQVALQERELALRAHLISKQHKSVAALERRLTVAQAQSRSVAWSGSGSPQVVSYGWGTY